MLRMLTLRCLSHGFSVVLFAFQILLAAIACLLGYVLLRDDIPVPDFLHGRIERELGRLGLAASFQSAKFDPTGRIFVTGLRLRPARFSSSILEADRVFIQFNRILLLAGKPGIDLVEVEHARVLCPPRISPSGVAETIFHVSSARIRRHHELWTVDGLTGTLGPARVAARGTYFAEPLEEGTPPPDIDRILSLYAKHAPDFVRAREWLAQVVDPALEITFKGSGKSVDISVEASALEWSHPRVGEADRVRLHLAGSIVDGVPQLPIRAEASAAEVSRPSLGKIESPRVFAEWVQLPSRANPWPDGLEIATGAIAHPRLSIDGARATVFPAAFPKVKADLWLPLEGENLSIGLAGDAEKRSGVARIEGRFGAGWLARASEILGRDVTYYATIKEPPDFAATAMIDEGLKWSRIEGRALSGPIVARGVSLDRVRIHGVVTPERVRLDRLEVSRGDEAATGTYEDSPATRANRFVLRGTMRPLSIAPWFSAWWPGFWKDYEFHDAPPRFEIDVRGNWLEGHKTVVTGHMRGEAITIRGHAFNSVDTRFFIRPNYYDLFDARLRRVEGEISGEVQLHFRPGDRNPARQSWRFESTADIAGLADIFGPGGTALFEPYRYEIPPAVTARGLITQEDGVYDTDIALQIRTPYPFFYYDFPLQSLETSVEIRNRRVELPAIDARYADGRVTGKAVVEDGRLTVEAALEDADYDLAVATFTDFLERQSPSPEAEKEALANGEGIGARDVGGRLDITLAAQGPLTQYQAYEGSGEARIREGDLAKIKLFGPLSDVLSSLGIKLGTLSLNEAHGQFDIRKEKLVFPRIRITGRTGALETEGAYELDDGSLDFKARLFPLRESSGFFTQVFGLLLEPVSNLLEMRLTGTLKDPHWT
ncbi:MAG: AsmA-like C-terminal region-containing protein, partial [Opitutaceae bacterium]